MPLHIPTVGESLTAALVWAAAARTLTDPASYKADVSGLAPAGEYDPEMGRITAARAAIIDGIDIIEFEKCQAPAAQNNAVAIAVTDADQSLGSKDITVDIPADATIISVIAVARINIMNNAATAQKIDLKFEVEGVVLFVQTDVLGFGAIDGSSAAYVIAEDATDEVTADEQVVTLEAKATLSAAASVRFQAQYYLFITYKMG